MITFVSNDIISNSDLTDNYFNPDISRIGDGRYVVVYQGDGQLSPAYDGIYGQIYDFDGVAIGSELTLNDTDAHSSMRVEPRVEEMPEGGFAVATLAGLNRVEFSHFSFDGSQFPDLSSDGWAQSPISGLGETPTIAVLNSGDVIVGYSAGRTGSNPDPDVRFNTFEDIRYLPSYPDDGTTWLRNTQPIGLDPTPWIEVAYDLPAATPDQNQRDLQVAALASGGFVAAWTQSAPVPFNQNIPVTGAIIVRIYSPPNQIFIFEPQPLGDRILVTDLTSTVASAATVAGLPDGGFVVAWQEFINDATEASTGIRARVYNADGTERSGLIAVNEITAGAQSDPDIDVFEDGRFVIVWEGPDRSFTGIWGRTFAADGTALSDDFAINQATSFSQTNPAVTVLTADRFAVAWQDAMGASEPTVVRTSILSTEDGGASPVNTAPVATNDVLTIVENSTTSFLASVLLNNDRDADGDLLTLTSVGNATNGTAGLNADGSVSFTPDTDFVGNASFTYTISDGQGGSDLGLVTFSVTEAAAIGPTLGDDTLNGGSGDDMIDGLAGDDVINGGLGNDTLSGGEGEDKLIALAGINVLSGGADSDFLIGGWQSDVLTGGSGDDILRGDASTLIGGADILDGGAGDDVLMGGKGADVFVFRPNDGNDTIAGFDMADVSSGNGFDVAPARADFVVGVDLIRLEGFAGLDASNVMSNIVVTADGAVFASNGTSITFFDITTAALSADSFEFA